MDDYTYRIFLCLAICVWQLHHSCIIKSVFGQLLFYVSLGHDGLGRTRQDLLQLKNNPTYVKV